MHASGTVTLTELDELRRQRTEDEDASLVPDEEALDKPQLPEDCQMTVGYREYQEDVVAPHGSAEYVQVAYVLDEHDRYLADQNIDEFIIYDEPRPGGYQRETEYHPVQLVPYSDPEGPWVEDGARPQQKRKSSKAGRYVAAAVLTVCGIAIVGGGAYAAKTIIDMSNVTTTEQEGIVVAQSGQLGASEEDTAMLKSFGYDAAALANRAQEFTAAFFTFSPQSIGDGSWEKGFSKYTLDLSEIETTSNENMIRTRTKDEWKNMVAEHPGYEGEVIGYESMSFGMSEDKLPYCDIVVIVSRPELDRYTVNSPALIIDKVLDTYRIVYDGKGKIMSVRRLQYRVLEQNSDPQLAAADAKALEKAAEERKKADEKARKELEEKAKAEEEKAKKAAEEEETKKKAAEEEAAERAQEEKEAQEAKEKEEAAKRQAEEAVRKKAEEEAAKKKAEEEAAAKKKAEEEAAAKKKAEEEEAARKKAEAEANLNKESDEPEV